MLPEYMEMVNKEIEVNAKEGKKYFRQGQDSLGRTVAVIRSLLGETSMYWSNEEGRWVLTRDSRYGGSPSVVDILRSKRIK